MATLKSAVRQWRRNLRRNAVNRSNKSVVRSQIKKLRQAIKDKNKEEAQKLLPIIFSTIDKAVKKGTIHENKGNRFKSRLSKQIEVINPSPNKA